MRPSLAVLISILLLSLLLSPQVQGIRLQKKLSSIQVEQSKLVDEVESTALRRNRNINAGFGDVIVCKEGHCKGKNRKLITATTSSTSSIPSTTTSKREKNGENKANPTSKAKPSNKEHGGMQEKFPINPPRSTSEQEEVHEQYADIMDIAEMDYSPAKRKPPIHN